jgi:uncharacterized SAM-dependent methyltransferase
MPWETRGGRRYFYRKERRGGRVFSVYEGGGLGGQLAEARAEEERKTRAQSRAELRREMAHQDAIDVKVEASWKVAERAARALLEAAGFHQHKRQWRLRRDEAKAG